MPDIEEIITQATHEVKRLGGDMQTLSDRTKQSVDGVHERLDAMETAFKRNGGGINTKPETAEEREYKTAFDKFVRTGDIANLKEMQQKSMLTAFDPDGGYLVPTELSNRIVQRVFEMSPMRSVAAVQTVSTGELEMLLDADEAEAVWVDETSPRGETRSPQLGKLRITVHEMSASPVVSQRLLEDSAVDVAGWLEKKIGDKFARKEGAAFVTGNGIGQPFGFLTRATEQGSKVARVYSGAASDIRPDSLFEAVYALKRAYRTKARWLMSRSAMLNIRTIKDEVGRYLWQPGLAAGQPDTLLGYPVVDMPDMPDVALGTFSVAFGDWDEAYTIADRLGITTLRDPYSKKPGVEISARKRVGGDVTNPEAFVVIKTGLEP